MCQILLSKHVIVWFSGVLYYCDQPYKRFNNVGNSNLRHAISQPAVILLSNDMIMVQNEKKKPTSIVAISITF